jgi:hypothetical protein
MVSIIEKFERGIYNPKNFLLYGIKKSELEEIVRRYCTEEEKDFVKKVIPYFTPVDEEPEVTINYHRWENGSRLGLTEEGPFINYYECKITTKKAINGEKAYIIEIKDKRGLFKKIFKETPGKLEGVVKELISEYKNNSRIIYNDKIVHDVLEFTDGGIKILTPKELKERERERKRFERKIKPYKEIILEFFEKEGIGEGSILSDCVFEFLERLIDANKKNKGIIYRISKKDRAEMAGASLLLGEYYVSFAYSTAIFIEPKTAYEGIKQKFKEYVEKVEKTLGTSRDKIFAVLNDSGYQKYVEGMKDLLNEK